MCIFAYTEYRIAILTRPLHKLFYWLTVCYCRLGSPQWWPACPWGPPAYLWGPPTGTSPPPTQPTSTPTTTTPTSTQTTTTPTSTPIYFLELGWIWISAPQQHNNKISEYREHLKKDFPAPHLQVFYQWFRKTRIINVYTVDRHTDRPTWRNNIDGTFFTDPTTYTPHFQT